MLNCVKIQATIRAPSERISPCFRAWVPASNHRETSVPVPGCTSGSRQTTLRHSLSPTVSRALSAMKPSLAERREPGIVQRPCLQAHAVELQEGLLPAQPRGHTRHFLRRDYRKRGVPVLLIAEVQGICVDSFPIVCGDVHPGGAAGHREVVCPDVQRQFIGVVACSRFSAAGGQQAQGHH